LKIRVKKPGFLCRQADGVKGANLRLLSLKSSSVGVRTNKMASTQRRLLKKVALPKKRKRGAFILHYFYFLSVVFFFQLFFSYVE